MVAGGRRSFGKGLPMSLTTQRRCLAPGITVARGEVLVATEVGDSTRGRLACPAAPLVGGALARRGVRVRYGPVPHCVEASRAGDGAAMFITSAQSREGAATGIGAAADPVDGVAMAAAHSAVEEWSAVVARRRLLAAAPPWCPGAVRALNLARSALAHGSAVHVHEWLAAGAGERTALEQAGAVFVTSLEEVPRGATLVLPAHGVPPAVRQEAGERGLAIVDATCPLVTAVHEQARRFAERGDEVVIIGARHHAAPGAIAAQATGGSTIVESPAGASGVRPADPRRVSYVLQPGIPVEDTATVSAALRSRFPALRGPDPDTFCYAATDRAEAIATIGTGSQLVLVLGDDGHQDTRMVASVVRAGGGKAQVIGETGDLVASWLAGVETIGLVETVSAAPGLVAAVIRALSGLGALSVIHRRVTTGSIQHQEPTGPPDPGDGNEFPSLQPPSHSGSARIADSAIP